MSSRSLARRQTDRVTNPWGITDLEAAVLDAWCELGSVKAVANALGLTHACVQSRVRGARMRLAGHKPHVRLAGVGAQPLHPVIAAVRWARWTSSQA